MPRYSSDIALNHALDHVPKFPGEVWYVSTSGSDSDPGTGPHEPFATLGAAISACSDGDSIIVQGGIYTEVGIDLNKNYITVDLQKGVLIQPATGTVLVVSGDYCLIGGGECRPSEDNIGVDITGTACTFHGVDVIGTNFLTGFKATGSIFGLTDCNVVGVKTGGKSFDIAADRCIIRECNTIGATSSYGFYISASGGYLVDCATTDCGASGYYLASGVSNWVVGGCTSGGGDGPWVDVDSANVWGRFTFDDEVFKDISFTDATQAFDIFTITGVVEIEFLHGHVTEAFNAELGNCLFRVYSTGGTAALTIAADCNSLPVGSFFGKIADASVALDVASAATPQVIENSSFRSPTVTSVLVADNDQTTTIQFYSDDSSGTKDGRAHFHCRWRPLSDGAFVAPA